MDNAKIAAEIKDILDNLDDFMQPGKKPNMKGQYITSEEWAQMCSDYSFQLGRLDTIKSLMEENDGKPKE